MINKRILSILLVLAMMLSMLPVIASAETASTPTIESVQLVLDSVLGLKLKVDLKGEPVSDYKVEVKIGNATAQILPGSADQKDGDLYVYTARLMAHQMTDNIQIYLKKGEDVVDGRATWSVKKNYVDIILADPTASDYLKELVTNMYYYGQYAAAYKYGTADPKIAAVTGVNLLDESDKLSVTKRDEELGTLGATAYLRISEACALGFRFNAAAMSGKTLWVDGTQVTTTTVGEQVEYMVRGILPQNYGDKHTVQVKNGETVIFEMQYSVRSYMCQSDGQTGYDSLKNLLRAMKLYGSKAKDYQTNQPIYLTEANAGTPALFKETIDANPSGNYALAEDLNWDNALFGSNGTEATTASAIAEFTGVLDGQGYTISNFRLGYSAADNDYHSAMFIENSGTIKNIGFDYTLSTANSSYTGLVWFNEATGVISNVFVDVTMEQCSGVNGTVAGMSAGTVSNCIAVINEASTCTVQNLAGVVGLYRTGSITNCYAISNGFINKDTAYVDCWGGLATPVYSKYNTNQLLLNGMNTSAEPFAGANGWSRFWRMTANGIAFGGKLVIGGAVCVHKDEKPVDGKCDSCNAALTPPAGVVLLNNTNAGTPTDFKTLVETNPDYTYYLTEDLDWTGDAGAAIAAFSGILDGQGHSIKGLVNGLVLVKNDQDNDDYTKSLIGVNTGTIKNLSIDYSITVAAGSFYSLIYKNEGTVENLFVKASFDVAVVASAAVAAINTSTIKNCVVSVSSADTANVANIGPVVFSERGGTIQNCHVVNNTANGITTVWNGLGTAGTYANNGVYANAQGLLDALTAMPAADGWSDCWAITGEGITFGGKVVIAGQATQPCTHEDTAYVDGKCDLCGETVELPTGTYLINSETLEGKTLSALINEDLDGHYYVTEDLTLTEQLAIGEFAGLLDGQGHTIKGFTIGLNPNSSPQWTGNAIDSNSGIIQNIGLEYTIADANNEFSALIGTNKGTVQNVYAKVVVNDIAAQQRNSAFISINGNTGQVKNCIVDATLASSITAVGAEEYGVVVHTTNGTIEKCYYTYTAASGITVPGVAQTWGAPDPTAALDKNATVNPKDGWSSCWEEKDDGIYFGSTLVMELCPHEDTAYVDGKCDICGETVALPTGTYLINSETLKDKTLSALINEDLDGHYYVTEDVTLGNEPGIGTFTGILDGQGHTLKGIVINMNSANQHWESTLFDSNSGTIENIAFEYSMTPNNNWHNNGLIGINTGTVQNVYVKATVTGFTSQAQYNGALVGTNDGATAVVRNCIVDVTLDASITTLDNQQFGAIVSVNGSAGIVENCYYKYTAASGITVLGIFMDNSHEADVKALDENATVNPKDGWSDCWTADLTGIYFSGTLVQELTPPCQHIDSSYVDGKCDICGEAVALPENTYLINSATVTAAGSLSALINGNLAGHYYVTEDVNRGSESGIGAFTGILDGQGHTLKGIVVNLNSSGDWESTLFASNSGTIENIALEYSIAPNQNNKNNGLIGINNGVVKNVYAKATLTAYTTTSIYSGALVGTNNGTITNCIVDVTVDEAITSLPMLGVVASLNDKNATIDECYYSYTATDGITVKNVYVDNSTTADAAALDNTVTSLPASAGWSDCWTGTPSGIWFSDTLIMKHEGNADDTIIVLDEFKVENISSETTIAHQGHLTEDQRANVFAWYDFEKLYEEITGKNITVQFVSNLNSLPSVSGNYFILGDDLAAAGGKDTSGITTDNGHKIVKDEDGNRVYLYGKSGYGTANAVYDFLKQAYGVEFFSDTVYTTTDNAYSINEISDVTFNPSVDYNWAYDGLLFRENGQAINYAYQMRMGFVNYWHIMGGSFHCFSDLFANGNYSTDVDLNAGGTIGPDSTYVQAVADYVYEQAKETGRPIIAVGPADTHTWSTSSASKANLEKYGANSGEYLVFMAEVVKLLNTADKYQDMPSVEVTMLLYNESLKAPNSTSIVDDLKDLNVNPARGVTLSGMFAPIEMNINGNPTDSTTTDYYGHTPSYYYGEYKNWQSVFGTKGVYFWRYSTIFNNYMIPVNTIEYMQANYQQLAGKDNSIKHLMDQGTGNSPVQTNFQALMVYLKGQLGKNVNADVDALITKFCKAYYGEAAGTYIKELLTAEQTHLNTMSQTMNTTRPTALFSSGTPVDNSGCHIMPTVNSFVGSDKAHNIFAEKWWSTNCSDDNGAMLQTWYGYITSALAAEGLTEEQRERIQVEAIAIRYISLKTHEVALVSGDTMAKVAADASALGITYWAEGVTITSLK